MDEQEKIGRRIATARDLKDWSQATLGKAVGLSQQMISKLETGESDATALLYEISASLGVRYRWLKFGELPMVADNPFVDATPDQLYDAFFNLPADQRADLFSKIAHRGVGEQAPEDEGR